MKQDEELFTDERRSNTPLVMKQTYNDVNKMDCDTAGHEQEQYDETSSDLKNMLIMCQRPSRWLIFNERRSAHSRPSTDSPICANSFAFFM